MKSATIKTVLWFRSITTVCHLEMLLLICFKEGLATLTHAENEIIPCTPFLAANSQIYLKHHLKKAHEKLAIFPFFVV